MKKLFRSFKLVSVYTSDIDSQEYLVEIENTISETEEGSLELAISKYEASSIFVLPFYDTLED